MLRRLFQRKLIKLNNINLKNTIENLIDTFLEAGKIAKKISERGVKITIKPDKTPVTDGDLAVDVILRKKIEGLTPVNPIVSEETVNLNSENKHKDFWYCMDTLRDKKYLENLWHSKKVFHDNDGNFPPFMHNPILKKCIYE